MHKSGQFPNMNQNMPTQNIGYNANNSIDSKESEIIKSAKVSLDIGRGMLKEKRPENA